MPSAAIRRYAYRPASATLDIEFVGGRTYRYFAVPEPIARELAEARSKGGYFNRCLRDRFVCERLAGGWDAPEDEPGLAEERVSRTSPARSRRSGERPPGGTSPAPDRGPRG